MSVVAEVTSQEQDLAFDVLHVIGTIAFGVSGAAAAMRAGMDFVGVMLLAVIVAVGGGSVRDVAIGNLPMWWITEWWAVVVALVTGLLLIPIRRWMRASPDSWRTVVVADALGLAAFAVTGASVTLEAGFHPWVAVVMGVITATFGGLIRDVLVNQKPIVLGGEVYASAAFLAALLFVVMDALGWPSLISQFVPVIVAFAFRMVAIQKRWQFSPLYLEPDPAGPATPDGGADPAKG